MSGTRIEPTPPALPSASAETQRLAPSAAELAESLAGLAGDLVRVDTATRLTRAQSQIEALLYAAQLAAVRGDRQSMRALAAEAGRVSRDLAAAGLDADQVGAIVAQARQVGQLCEDGGASMPSSATSRTAPEDT
jgi:hypothetical protein